MKLMGLLFIVIVGLTVLTVAAPAVEAETVTRYFCVDDANWSAASSWSDSIDGNGDCNGNTGVPDSDDHVIILTGLTCEMQSSLGTISDIIVEADAVVNVAAGKSISVNASGQETGLSTITGTINLVGDGSAVRVITKDHTIDGGGKIVGQHSGALIAMGGGRTLINQTTIEGTLTIEDTSVFDSKFTNQGTVNANASGTLAIETNELEDSSAGLWQVSASGAVLKFDIEETAKHVLSSDFEVSNGTLDIDVPEFETSGVLTFTGGIIDCAGLTGTQVAKFTGSP